MRLIDEAGKPLGVVLIQEALNIAREQGLDLVEVAAKARPPVCRIMDYGKFKYRESKNKQRPQKHKLKHIRVKLNTGQHDLETKLQNANKFLKKGHKIRIEIQLRGREKAHFDLARKKLQEFIEQIKEKIKIDQNIKKSGRGLDTILCRE